MSKVGSAALMVSDAKELVVEATFQGEIVQVEIGSVAEGASDLATKRFEAFKVDGEDGRCFGDDELFGGVDEFLASARGGPNALGGALPQGNE